MFVSWLDRSRFPLSILFVAILFAALIAAGGGALPLWRQLDASRHQVADLQAQVGTIAASARQAAVVAPAPTLPRAEPAVAVVERQRLGERLGDGVLEPGVVTDGDAAVVLRCMSAAAREWQSQNPAQPKAFMELLQRVLAQRGDVSKDDGTGSAAGETGRAAGPSLIVQ